MLACGEIGFKQKREELKKQLLKMGSDDPGISKTRFGSSRLGPKLKCLSLNDETETEKV